MLSEIEKFLKPVVSVANNELAKIQSIDHKLKNLMTIIGETHTDNDVNDRLLNLEVRIEKLEKLIQPSNKNLTPKHEIGHSVVDISEPSKPFRSLNRSKSTCSISSNANLTYRQNLYMDYTEEDKNATET